MTLHSLMEILLHLILPVSLSLFFLMDRTSKNFIRILILAFIYIIYNFLLELPQYGKPFSFIQSNWNWDGKLYAIIFAVCCYFLSRKLFSENDFFTLKQENKSNKITWIVTIAVIVIISTIYYFIGDSDFDGETLAFQLFMPAMDEEMIFRGIMLGLLLTALPKKIRWIGNPSIIITAILFGFMHALSLSADYKIEFGTIYFCTLA